MIGEEGCTGRHYTRAMLLPAPLLTYAPTGWPTWGGLDHDDVSESGLEKRLVREQHPYPVHVPSGRATPLRHPPSPPEYKVGGAATRTSAQAGTEPGS